MKKHNKQQQVKGRAAGKTYFKVVSTEVYPPYKGKDSGGSHFWVDVSCSAPKPSILVQQGTAVPSVVLLGVNRG